MEVNIDANNNSTDKKGYSLRPRSAPKQIEDDDLSEDAFKPRGRTLRSPKQKTLPLSKYRRKTANARERSRMREINEAFETLRRSIPLINTKCDNPNEKNTKISTLRLAMKYITVLSSALKESDGDSDKESIFSEYSLPPPDCRDAYTPTSSSDNSDFSDALYNTSLSHELSSQCVSPISSSSLLSLPEITSSSRLPIWNLNLDKTDYRATIVTCSEVRDKKLDMLQDVRDTKTTSDSPPRHQISRLSTFEECDAVEPSPSYSHAAALDSNLRYTSLTPVSLQLQPTHVIEDWEELDFSREDFDELLST